MIALHWSLTLGNLFLYTRHSSVLPCGRLLSPARSDPIPNGNSESLKLFVPVPDSAMPSPPCRLCVAVLIAVIALACADDAVSIDEVGARFALAPKELQSLRVKQLKEMLVRKGAKCEACASKGDLIERIIEVSEWEDVKAEEKEGNGGMSDEEVARINEKLKMSQRMKGQKFQIMGKDGKMEEIDMNDFIKKMEKDEKAKKGEAAAEDAPSKDNSAEEKVEL